MTAEKVAEKLMRSETERTIAATPARIPLNGMRLKMASQEIPGYHLYWFNDETTRVQDALAAGYEFVTSEQSALVDNVVPGNSDLSGKVRKLVGVVEGRPLYAYLMKIKNEWYEEDERLRQSRLEELDRHIQSGDYAGKMSDGRYVPTSGIKYKP